MKSIVYVGPFDEVETDFGNARRGERFDVPDEAAGRAPKGKSWAESYDPGEGLLAQPDNWQPYRPPAKKSAAKKTAGQRQSAKKTAAAAGGGQPAEHTEES